MEIRTHIVSVVVVCAAATAAQAQPVPGYVLDSLRMRFERNVGQAPSDAQFIARDSGYDLMLTRGGGVIRGASHRDVRIVFSGGDMTSWPIGEAASPGVVNYLRGNDPSRWHTNIATFERVRYPRVYPGIDVVYHASQGQMEYDIVVEAGADLEQVRMRFDGADRVVLQDSGDLAVHIDDRIVTVKRPVLYQETGAGRRTVDGTFVRLASGDIGFEVGAYDPRVALVIDPVLVYSSYLPMRDNGASLSSHEPAAVAVAADGATYIMGTVSIPFAGLPQNDIFIAKINPSGSALTFITYLGGTGTEIARALALGASGEIYLAGRTLSWDFPTLSAAQTVYGGGNGDAFLAKLSAAGDALEYATFAGGSSTDFADAVVVDADGNAYLVGTTSSANFPVLASPAAYAGSDDAFVAKYDSMGSRVFALLIGGSSLDQAHAASLAPDGMLIVAGETVSADFPVTPGAFDITPSSFEGFILRFRPSDGLLLQSTLLGGTGADMIRAMDTDAAGAVYVTGSTASTDFQTTPGVVQPSAGSNTNFKAFAAKLSADLSALVYSTYLMGSGSESGALIAVDSIGQAVVGGSTSTGSINFPQFNPLFTPTTSTVPPSFLTKLSANASQFVYSTFWPASLTALTSGPTGDAYVAGTMSPSHGLYPTTADALLAPTTFEFSIRSVFARISDASPACSYQVGPSPVIVSSSSGSRSLSVVAPSGCSWSVVSSDPSWLTPSTISGSGTRTATFTTTSLLSGFRSATLSIGNGVATQLVTVYQRACFTTLSSVPLQPAAGGAVVVNVTGSAGCPFVTVTDAPWVTVEPAFGVLDGGGQAQVTLTLSANAAISQRSATVYVSDSSRNGGSLTVQQAGLCTASLSSSSLTAHRTGSTALVTVTVAPPDCAWTVRSDSPWLVPSVSSAVGSQTIAIAASAVTTFSRTGRLSIAGLPFTVNQNGPTFSSAPVVYPPVPPAGSGHAQTFTFSFLDSNGAANLSVVNVLINNFLDGGSACYLAYARSINVLYLVNDAGDALLPGMVLNGGIETLGNSQCSIDGSGSSVTVDGDLLTLTLKMAFSPEFAGNKVVYQAARNESGFNSGWVQQGVWNVPGQTTSLEVVSLTPSRNAASGYPLQFRFRHPDGADHLVSTSILINSYLDGFRGCYLGYHVPTNAVLLLNDAGNGYIGSVVLGTNMVIENSQCRIRAQQSGVAIDGTDLTLTLRMEFKAGLAGDRVFYVSAQDAVSTSGWQAVGSWTVP